MKGDGEAAEQRQNHEQWDCWGPLGGFTPGRGVCTQVAWLRRAVSGQGSKWILQGAGVASGMCHPCSCATGGSLDPPRQGPLGQGPTGSISTFLFLILLFSYRSTYLRMMVIGAFIKG